MISDQVSTKAQSFGVDTHLIAWKVEGIRHNAPISELELLCPLRGNRHGDCVDPIAVLLAYMLDSAMQGSKYVTQY